jgi:hypothetical protein
MSSLDGKEVKAPVIVGGGDETVEVPENKMEVEPPAKVAAQTVETMIAAAIDKATGEIVTRLDDLIKQLQAMKEYTLKDAERVKGEIGSHLLVRNKASDLAENVRSEMAALSTRLP